MILDEEEYKNATERMLSRCKEEGKLTIKKKDDV